VGAGGVDVRARSIRITFTLNGKQERRTLSLNGVPLPPTPANIRYAERLAAEIREKVRLGIFVMAEYFPVDGQPEAGVTVERQIDTWLGSLRIEESTRAGYASAKKFWVAALPNKPLRALKLSEILTATAARPDLSGKTINNYVSVLREALALAVDDGLIDKNPAEDVPRAKHQKEPPDPFTVDESTRIIELALQRHPGQVHNLIEFWFWTGLRTSEVLGLSWGNVDIAKGSILVSVANVRGKIKERTKTNVARTVRLNSRALAAIKRQRAYTQVLGGPVFMDPRYGQRWDEERAFRRSFWTPMLKSLGIRYRRPYNMRHSYATAMLMAGMTPAFCAKQLGHSVEVFLRTYAKWIDSDQNDREMERLEVALSPAYPREIEKAP
jgi:integrase